MHEWGKDSVKVPGTHWGDPKYRVYNKKPSPKKIFIKNLFFKLFKQNFIQFANIFNVISGNFYEKIMVFKNSIAV